MIRPFAEVDLDAVMEIWLSSNLQAHPFIVPSYWAEHLEEVKRLIPQAEVYVHESDGVVNGFLGLTEAGEYCRAVHLRAGARAGDWKSAIE